MPYGQWHVTQTWDEWLQIIVFLRGRPADRQPRCRPHADALERMLDACPADQDPVTLQLSDDIFMRSVHWAGYTLGFTVDYQR